MCVILNEKKSKSKREGDVLVSTIQKKTREWKKRKRMSWFIVSDDDEKIRETKIKNMLLNNKKKWRGEKRERKKEI